MGTRADFYVGRGESAEWLGSIAWDGYPSGITPENGEWPEGAHLFTAATEQEYRERLTQFFAGRRDVTLPANGWPWPWEDSNTTDYSYAFDGGKVWATCFGYQWFDPNEDEPEVSDEDEKVAVFPKFSKDRMAAPGSVRSGIMVIGL